MKALTFAIAASLISAGAYAQFPAATKGGTSATVGFPDVARLPNPPVAAKLVPMPMPAPKIVVTPPVVTKQPVRVPLPAASPAYKLDPEAGQVKFGDGSHGARPPSGADVASRYRRGGGTVKLPAVQNPRKLPAVQAPAMKPGAMPLTPLDDPRLSKKGAGKDASVEQLQLQDAMQNESRRFQTISNAAKAKSDSEKNAIDNMK